jgi:hypothetical protein
MKRRTLFFILAFMLANAVAHRPAISQQPEQTLTMRQLVGRWEGQWGDLSGGGDAVLVIRDKMTVNGKVTQAFLQLQDTPLFPERWLPVYVDINGTGVSLTSSSPSTGAEIVFTTTFNSVLDEMRGSGSVHQLRYTPTQQGFERHPTVKCVATPKIGLARVVEIAPIP